jgi:hypothetical protein
VLLQDRAKDQPGAIKAPATNLTIGTGVAAALATAATLFNDSFNSIFGDDASAKVKASVLIAVIAAWTLIAVADLIARAVANAAAAGGGEQLAPLPTALAAAKTTGTDKTGYAAAAVRVGATGETSFLLVKKGQKPEWLTAEEIDLGS